MNFKDFDDLDIEKEKLEKKLFELLNKFKTKFNVDVTFENILRLNKTHFAIATGDIAKQKVYPVTILLK